MAWLDADIAMAQNIFTLISRWYDFGATWSGGGEAPLPFMQSLLGFPLKVCLPYLYEVGSKHANATKAPHKRQVVSLSLVPLAHVQRIYQCLNSP